ncbi:MAG: GntR family transcriptional regulator [Planctomycetia bacterium]|nr:GntR family transcriptional regulator [Planctomycetia bacterium]
MPASSPTLTQHVYDRLRQQLLSGQLDARAQLVNRTIARELGTSTIPVREAIQRLASEGLVEYVPGAGAFVRQPDRRELAQLYDLREALEPLAAAEAARNSAAYELDELQAYCDAWQELAVAIPARGHATRQQLGEWLDLEERFHALLAAATRNPWLERMLNGVRLVAMVCAAQRGEPDLLTPALARKTCREHAELVRALRARDADRARDWMLKHVRHGRGVVLDYFDRKPSGPRLKSAQE